MARTQRVEALSIFKKRIAAVEAILSTRTIKFNKDTGWLELSKPVTHLEWKQAVGTAVPEGYDPESVMMGKTRLLSPANTKMYCACFSLSAGPPEYYGTCTVSRAHYFLTEVQAATSTHAIEHETRLDAQRMVESISPKPAQHPAWVCDMCYAQGGNELQPSLILRRAVVTQWTQAALKAGNFTRAMVTAIKLMRNTFVKLAEAELGHPLQSATQEQRLRVAPGCRNPDYFRIHDSGDFFSVEYFKAWCAVARALPDMQFWAATRAFADEEFVGKIKAQRLSIPRNLSVRPSSLWVDTPLPKGVWPGTVGTVVESLPWTGKFICPAYSSETGTCQASDASYEGKSKSERLPSGCRACWDGRKTLITYPKH